MKFKVSSDADQPFSARLLRVISADPNPDGPGIIEQAVEAEFAGDYPSRIQPFYPGSYAKASIETDLDWQSFTVQATIWPTTPAKGKQGIISSDVFSLMIADDGAIAVEIKGASDTITLTTEAALKPRHWYRVWASFDPSSGHLCVGQQLLEDFAKPAIKTSHMDQPIDNLSKINDITIAAMLGNPVNNHYNGKIEAPTIHNRRLSNDEILNNERIDAGLVAAWDFSQHIDSTKIVDTGPYQLHGELINFPARAMTGSHWTGEEMCWQHKPQHYGAIHFHDDDIYDFDWDTDFSFTIPNDLPSGVYAARISCGEYQDSIPFFVCPPLGKRSADLCVLVSTFTYSVYGNHARPDFKPEWKQSFKEWNAYPWNPAEHREYGLSTYNFHSDGSGICHASHRRPLV